MRSTSDPQSGSLLPSPSALTKTRSTTGVVREVSTISSQRQGINRPHNPLRRHMLNYPGSNCGSGGEAQVGLPRLRANARAPAPGGSVPGRHGGSPTITLSRPGRPGSAPRRLASVASRLRWPTNVTMCSATQASQAIRPLSLTPLGSWWAAWSSFSGMWPGCRGSAAAPGWPGSCRPCRPAPGPAWYEDAPGPPRHSDAAKHRRELRAVPTLAARASCRRSGLRR
jgi:hypothetical protein